MINKKQAEKFCSEQVELIENYEKAMSDTTQTWHCHHIWETMLDYSKQELIEIDEYYGIPACNLIFLTPAEHMIAHHTGKPRNEETRRKISNSRIGIKFSEEHRKKLSDKKKGKNNSNRSKCVLQYTIEGNFVKEYPSLHEVTRECGFDYRNIHKCCSGEIKTAYKYIWKYKEK